MSKQKRHRVAEKYYNEIFVIRKERSYYHKEIFELRSKLEMCEKIERNLIKKYKTKINFLTDYVGCSKREMAVMKMRYDISQKGITSYERVGQYFCVTRERIRQLELKIMDKINGYFINNL